MACAWAKHEHAQQGPLHAAGAPPTLPAASTFHQMAGQRAQGCHSHNYGKVEHQVEAVLPECQEDDIQDGDKLLLHQHLLGR